LANSNDVRINFGRIDNYTENKTGIIFMPLQTITQLKEALPWHIFTEKSRDRHGLQQRAEEARIAASVPTFEAGISVPVFSALSMTRAKTACQSGLLPAVTAGFRVSALALTRSRTLRRTSHEQERQLEHGKQAVGR